MQCCTAILLKRREEEAFSQNKVNCSVLVSQNKIQQIDTNIEGFWGQKYQNVPKKYCGSGNADQSWVGNVFGNDVTSLVV